ncbi:hypothetical protein BDAG_01856 [Burkholderia dolosa AU0158]|nr:hypothetical protein BDAG_01856 [Burkholderia dolosa AU0158]
MVRPRMPAYGAALPGRARGVDRTGERTRAASILSTIGNHLTQIHRFRVRDAHACCICDCGGCRIQSGACGDKHHGFAIGRAGRLAIRSIRLRGEFNGGVSRLLHRVPRQYGGFGSGCPGQSFRHVPDGRRYAYVVASAARKTGRRRDRRRTDRRHRGTRKAHGGGGIGGVVLHRRRDWQPDRRCRQRDGLHERRRRSSKGRDLGGETWPAYACYRVHGPFSSPGGHAAGIAAVAVRIAFTRTGGRMKWLADKAALLASAVVLAGLAWAVLHFAGQWYFAVGATLAVVLLFVENHKLKKRLRELDDKPRGR